MIYHQVVVYSVAILIVLALILFIIYIIKSKGARAVDESDDEQSKQIYVGNLSYRVRERTLRDHFARFGEVAEVRIVKNRSTGRSKGFGFVTFTTYKQAKKALGCHGEDFQGRALVVRIAKSR